MASLQSFTLIPDGTSVELTFDSRVQVLRADELDSLIGQLGELRSRMQPAITHDPAQVTSAHLAEDYYFARKAEGNEGVPVKAGGVFLFQSPRFGWFQFPASAELCAGLAKWLETGEAEDAAR